MLKSLWVKFQKNWTSYLIPNIYLKSNQMTFGKVKSIIEKNLLESYKNETEFKKHIKEFKHNVLNDNSISKVYSIYEQLNTPQGLSETEAKEFLEEGISLIQRILPNIKMPKSLNESVQNYYMDIDTLVYTKTINLSERIKAKKNIVSILSKPKNKIEEGIKIPVSTMVKIANNTLGKFTESMDESTKNLFKEIVNLTDKQIEEKFNFVKESAIKKLNTLIEISQDNEIKTKISETIEKIEKQKIDKLSLVKIIELEKEL